MRSGNRSNLFGLGSLEGLLLWMFSVSFVSLPPSACHVHIAVRRNDFPKLYAMSWRGMGGDCQRIAVGRHSMWETRSHGDAKLPSKHGTDENTSGLELCCRPWLTPLSLEQQLGDTEPKSISGASSHV